VFGIVMRKVIRRGNFTSVANLEAKLRAFLNYFNLTLAHPFDWTYTGKPLIKLKPPPFCPPHRRRRFIHKLSLANDSISLSAT
jgi:hypothetical protein